MRKIFSGQGQTEPYRPWPTERRKAAVRLRSFLSNNPYWIGERGRRAQELWLNGLSFSDIAFELGTTRDAVAGYLRRKNLSDRSFPEKQIWHTPEIIEIGMIREDPDQIALAQILYLNDDDDDFDVEERTTYCAIEHGDRCFEFEKSMIFEPGYYSIDVAGKEALIVPMDGEFEQIVPAKAHA